MTSAQIQGSQPGLLRQLGFFSATALVISNMVGTGIFATTGFMAGDLGSAGLILACWTVGNYLICPLRWQSVSTRGKSLAWYARIFAEGELLGMPRHLRRALRGHHRPGVGEHQPELHRCCLPFLRRLRGVLQERAVRRTASD